MQTPKIINAFFLFYVCCFFFSSCESTIVETQYIPDTKGLESSMELIRFEQDFFSIDTTKISVEIEKLKEKHPEFTIGFLSSFLGVHDSISQEHIVNGYLNYKDARYTYDTVQLLFKDLSQTQKELNELATYYTYYFPDAVPLRKAFTYLCEYHGDRMAMVEEGFVGLPLDMALGQGYPPYTFLKMPLYDQRTCTGEHLVAKAADAVAQHIVASQCKQKGSHLIDAMLYNGKIMYLTDLLLPTVPDSLLFGFSSEQMTFCKEGELTLYEHISKEELFYSNDTKKYSRFISKGPFNPALGLQGNSGSWLGYRMLKSFAFQNRMAMQQANPNLSPRDLDQQLLKMVLEENDPQKILAKYKPPKK